MINETDLEAFDYWNAYDLEPKKTKTPLDMVKEYHKTSGLPVGLEYEDASPAQKQLRWDLISEEYVELMTSAGTPSEIVKEMADLLYVLYGTAVTFGWDLDEIFKRVHENNMGRMYQDDGSIKRRDDGKVIKNPGYPKVNFDDLL